MDPISLSSDAAARVRPAPGLVPDVAAVLQQGRVLGGEVLQVFGGGTVVIGVGHHRVTAQSQVELEPGQRFLFRVEGEGDELTLRLLQRGDVPETPLVRALREHLAQERPIGRLLADLAARLRAGLAAEPGDGAAARLSAGLEEHAFRPGSDGAALRALVTGSGQALEASLAAGARALDAGRPTTPMLVRELAAWLAGDGAPPELVRALEAAVTGVLDASDARTAEPGALLARIGRALAGLLAGLPDVAARAGLARRAAQLAAEGEPPERELALVRGWLAGGPPAPARFVAQALAALVGRDLKALLLRAEADLEDGEPLAAVRRLLAGVEAEQILNAGRRASGHGPVVSIPVPDPGGGWATLRLERRGEGQESGGAGGAGSERLALEVELSGLGPLRADLLWTDERLAVRLVVESEETAGRLRADLLALRELFDVGERSVHVSVVKGTRREASLEPSARGVAWLDDHHLMDLSA